MADMTITGDARFGTVIDEMKRVERASDSMKRKVGGMGGAAAGKGASYRSSQGILEISRGVEDFAVAGMRGLLNNIPGIIMSLGGGMGLAGVISLAAVGVSLFGKDLLELVGISTKSEEAAKDLAAANEKYAESLKQASSRLKEYRQEQELAANATKNAARMEESFRRFGDPAGQASRRDEMREMAFANQQSLFALQSELAKIGGNANPIQPDLIGNLDEQVASAKKLIEDLGKQRAQVEREMDKASIAGMGDFGARVHDLETAIAFAEREAERHRALMKDSEGMYAKARETLAKSEERKADALKKELAALKQQEGFRDKEIEAYADKIKAIEKEVQGAKRAESTAKKRLEYAKQEAELRQKIEEKTAINNERRRFGAALLEGIEKQAALMARFSEIDSVLSQMTIRGDDMLSSSGRIGGSVAEYNSAIATINYQRESLTELRKIARNTAKRQSSTYN